MRACTSGSTHRATVLCATVLCATVWGSIFAGIGVAADWNYPRGDAMASGATSIQLPAELTVAWEFKADDAIEMTPIVSQGRVFFADAGGTIYALSQSEGTELWRKKFDTGFLVTPVVVGDQLVISDWDGIVYALSADDGTRQWSYETGGEILGSPALFADKVLIASSDAKLYCLRSDSGELAWTYEADDQIQCSPTIAGELTFLGGCDGKLHVVDLNTGKAAGESLPLDGPSGSTPAVHGQRVVVPTHGGAVFAFDWKDRKQLWRHDDPFQAQEYRSSAAIAGDVAVAPPVETWKDW